MTPSLQLTIEIAQDNKAQDICLLDMREVCSFTDYFLIFSGTSTRQIQSVSDSILEALKKSGAPPLHVEGYRAAEWVLIDFFDFVVHIFSRRAREFYDLERLWGTAPHIDLPKEIEKPSPPEVPFPGRT